MNIPEWTSFTTWLGYAVLLLMILFSFDNAVDKICAAWGKRR